MECPVCGEQFRGVIEPGRHTLSTHWALYCHLCNRHGWGFALRRADGYRCRCGAPTMDLPALLEHWTLDHMAELRMMESAGVLPC